MIQVKNITKIYNSGINEVQVLKNISFETKTGEFIAIIGKSGSGKSTLLYQMSLLDTPTKGEILMNGLSTKDFSEDERMSYRLHEFGYIFQDYALIPSLTALENVMTPLIMLGMSFDVAKKNAKDVLERVGLGDKIDNLPSQLSGGQQQRVSIARAIGGDPKVLFADEPTANLDTETSQQILKVFSDLNDDGQTIIMVTHEEDYAKLTDRILTLSDGVIISDKKIKK